MIKKILYKNFKNYEEAELTIENLTLLIGTNASGKTNAIEGLMILSEAVAGRSLSIVLDGTKMGPGAIRGGGKGCCHLNDTSFGLGCIVAYDDSIDLKYMIEIASNSKLCVLRESLVEIKNNKEKVIFETNINSAHDDIIVADCNNNKAKHPQFDCDSSVAVISQLKTKIAADTQYGANIIAYSKCIIKDLTNILFLNPDLARMRGYSSIDDATLKVDAGNLSSVLYSICETQTKRERLINILRKLPENEIDEIDFIKGGLNDVILSLSEKYGSENVKIDATRLSDGTLRCLTVLAALLSIEKGGLIVMEEIDNGIHPGRARQLIHEISKMAQENSVDVLLTTHNSVLLNSLTKDELVGVNIAYREKMTGNGKIQALMGIKTIPMLFARGKLGDVFISDEILDFIKNEPNPVDFEILGVK